MGNFCTSWLGPLSQLLALPRAEAGSRFPMGGSASTFSQEELDVYEACTCLSGAEILELYEKFTDLGGVRKKDAADERQNALRII